MSSFVYLYSIALLVFIGTTTYLLAIRLKFPHSLLLILAGTVISTFKGLIIPPVFYESIILLALMMVVFDVFSRYKISSLTSLHSKLRSFKIIYFALGMPVLIFLSFFMFKFDNILYPALFSVLILSNSRSYINNFRPLKKKIAHTLEIESIKVTCFVILIAAVILQSISAGPEFSSTLAEFAEILVMMMLGIMIKVPFDLSLIIKSLFIFIIFLAVRFITFSLTLNMKWKERIFLTLYSPKDIATGAILLFIVIEFPAMTTVFHLVFLFIIYSLITAYAGSLAEKKFTKTYKLPVSEI